MSEEDEEDLVMLKYLVHKGAHVLDIGAHIGVYTRFLSRFVGPDGKVYSFEPIPETYLFLENNIKKLHLQNVTALNTAISDYSGKVIMEVPKYDNAGDNYYEARIVNNEVKDLKSFEVECNTLDQLYQKYNFHPSFIKCDVEGFEWNVFKSAENILMKAGPVLLIEINQDLNTPDSKTKELLEFLNIYGYDIFIKQDNKLRAWKDEKKVNYYFLKQKHLNELKAKGLISL
ncbi:MAG: FkbM family methyltransferase [Bacteroidales bacterium]|nr:MAG: FkbM family methyltransferase [Bacteroidales bacterium]